MRKLILFFIFILPFLSFGQGVLVTPVESNEQEIVNFDQIGFIYTDASTNTLLVYADGLRTLMVEEHKDTLIRRSCSRFFNVTLSESYPSIGDEGGEVGVNLDKVEKITEPPSGGKVQLLFSFRYQSIFIEEPFLSVVGTAATCSQGGGSSGNVCSELPNCAVILAMQDDIANNTNNVATNTSDISTNQSDISTNQANISNNTTAINNISLTQVSEFLYRYTDKDDNSIDLSLDDSLGVSNGILSLYQRRANGTYLLKNSVPIISSDSFNVYSASALSSSGNSNYWKLLENNATKDFIGFYSDPPLFTTSQSIEDSTVSLLDLSPLWDNIGNSDLSILENRNFGLAGNDFSITGTNSFGNRSVTYGENAYEGLIEGAVTDYVYTYSPTLLDKYIYNATSGDRVGEKTGTAESYSYYDVGSDGNEQYLIGVSDQGLVARTQGASPLGWSLGKSDTYLGSDIITYLDPSSSGITFNNNVIQNAPVSQSSPSAVPNDPVNGADVVDFYVDYTVYWTYNGNDWQLIRKLPVNASNNDQSTSNATFVRNNQNATFSDNPLSPLSPPSSPADQSVIIELFDNGTLYWTRVNDSWILTGKDEKIVQSSYSHDGDLTGLDTYTVPTANINIERVFDDGDLLRPGFDYNISDNTITFLRTPKNIGWIHVDYTKN